MTMHLGTINKENGSFGFIKPDEPGASDMFVIPPSCKAFGKAIPPVGTRVQFSVVEDHKTGRPRAEDVQPVDGGSGVADTEAWAAQELAAAVGAMGAQEAALGVEAQATHAQQAAEPLEVDVQSTAQQLAQQLLADLPGLGQIDLAALTGGAAAQASAGGQNRGTVQSNSGKFGFISQDTGGDMFCLPPIPPVGTRVAFDIVTDPKTGRPRADNVTVLDAAAEQTNAQAQATLEQYLVGGLLNAFAPQTPEVAAVQGQGSGQAAAAAVMAAAMGRATGIMAADRGSFGFIKQDSGGPDMFTLPPFFPLGTRVSFEVVADPKTGRPRADNVTDDSGNHPAIGLGGYGAAAGGKGLFAHRASPYSNGLGFGGGAAAAAALGLGAGAGAAMGFGGGGMGLGGAGKPQSQPSDQLVTGIISKTSDKFAFITQDSGEADMFVIPPACEAFGKVLPAVGTRVMYHVVIDQRSGRPRAEGVQPAPEM